MPWSEAQEVAASMAAQIGEASLVDMTGNAIRLYVRKEMPGECRGVLSAISQALEDRRNDLAR